jgi:hypothetical protein
VSEEDDDCPCGAMSESECRIRCAAPRYNVIAINLTTHARRIIAEDKSEQDAEAIVCMAVARRGVEEECFTTERIVERL